MVSLVTSTPDSLAVHSDLQFRALCLLLELERLGKISGWPGVADAIRVDTLHSVRVIAGARAAEALMVVISDPRGMRERPWKILPVSDEEISARAHEVCADVRVAAAYGFVADGKRLLGALNLSEDFRAHAFERLEQLWRAANRAFGRRGVVGAESAPPVAPAVPAPPAASAEPPAAPAEPAPPAPPAPPVEMHPADVVSLAAAMMAPAPTASAAPPTVPETPSALAGAVVAEATVADLASPTDAEDEHVVDTLVAKAVVGAKKTKSSAKRPAKQRRKKGVTAPPSVEGEALGEEAPKTH